MNEVGRKAQVFALVNGPSRAMAAPGVSVADAASADQQAGTRSSQGLAYAGLYLFTLLLYMRPNELFPGIFGSFPIAKIVAIGTLASYVLSKLSQGGKLTDFPTELKMVLIIALLGVAFIPVAEVPKDSIDVLTDTYSKVVIIFILFINLVDTRARLLGIIRLTVLYGTWIALEAIKRYAAGELGMENRRIIGAVGGMFNNPNDLAISFDLLLPLAIILFLLTKGVMRYVYLACAVIFAAGVVVTFSRGGFLGLAASGGLMLWKLSRKNRGGAIGIVVVVLVLFLFAMPSGYSSRISSISSEELDVTGSSWERQEILKRAFNVALHHPIVGIGMGNFHAYSLGEKVAHNSYVEIWAELGLLGFGAYLVLIFAPFRSMRRLETEVINGQEREFANGLSKRDFYLLSVGFQAILVAYIVISFFGSIQYIWHIYYLAGYAIALRGMWAREKVMLNQVGNPTAADQKSLQTGKSKGALWKSYRLHSQYR